MEEAKSKCARLLSEINSIWQFIGLDDEEMDSYENEIASKLVSICEDAYHESISLRDQIILDIAATQKETEIMSERLSFQHSEITLSTEMTLKQKSEILKARWRELNEVYQNRMETINQLMKEIASIQSELGQHNIDIGREARSQSGMVTLQVIAELKNAVEDLNFYKEKRRSQVEQLRESIVALWNEMEIPVETELERTYLRSREGELPIHFDCVKRLEDKYNFLKEKRSKRVEERDKLITEINKLVSRMPEESKKALSILTIHSSISTKDLRSLRDEKDRLEEMKKQNMEKLLHKARIEIEGLWELLSIDESERSTFLTIFADESEETLVKCEKEISRLNEVYNSIKPLMDLVFDHINLMKEMDEFEQASSDPKRLTSRSTNRDPGRLLREENYRNTTSKKLAKIESDIQEKLTEFEAKFNKPFLINGKRYLDQLQDLNESRFSKKRSSRMISTPSKVTKEPLTPLRSATLNYPSSPSSVTPLKKLKTYHGPGGQENKQILTDSSSMSATKSKSNVKDVFTK